MNSKRSNPRSLGDRIKAGFPVALVVIGLLCIVRLIWIAYDGATVSNGRVLTPDEIRSAVERQTALDKEAVEQGAK